MKNRKLVLLKDLDGNEFRIAPSLIVDTIQYKDYSIVETEDGKIITRSDKQIIENSIQNCYLP